MKHRFHEHVSRSLLKAVTFRLVALTFDGVIIFVITGRYDITLRVVFLANLVHTVIYFAHERLWNGVHWGKLRHKSQ